MSWYDENSRDLAPRDSDAAGSHSPTSGVNQRSQPAAAIVPDLNIDCHSQTQHCIITFILEWTDGATVVTELENSLRKFPEIYSNLSGNLRKFVKTICKMLMTLSQCYLTQILIFNRYKTT